MPDVQSELSLEEQIAAVRGAKGVALDGQDFERAAGLRDREKRLMCLRSNWPSSAPVLIRVGANNLLIQSPRVPLPAPEPDDFQGEILLWGVGLPGVVAMLPSETDDEVIERAKQWLEKAALRCRVQLVPVFE